MRSEDYEQFMFVTWFRNTYKGVRIYAIPNGGKRSKATAMVLKSTGVSAGVPDLHIPEWRLWIEMKRTKGGVVSKEQKEWIAYLNGIGDTAVVCKGFEEAKAFVSEFQNTRLIS